MTKSSPFVTGEYYHVFNRGVDKRKIFLDKFDFGRFVKSISVFNSTDSVGSILEHEFNLKFGRPMSKKRLVDVVCYCLNENHFHILLRQRVDGGLGEFIRRVTGGYTKYFNHRYKRSGVLFQGGSRWIHIDSNEYLLHVSAYVNLNNKAHSIRGNFFRSSWKEYTDSSVQPLCTKGIILKQFRNIDEYIDFAKGSLNDIVERKTSLAEIKKLLLE
jgi:putative transposase